MHSYIYSWALLCQTLGGIDKVIQNSGSLKKPLESGEEQVQGKCLRVGNKGKFKITKFELSGPNYSSHISQNVTGLHVCCFLIAKYILAIIQFCI